MAVQIGKLSVITSMKMLLATLVCVIGFGCASSPTARTTGAVPPIEVSRRDECRELVQAANLAIEVGDFEMAQRYLNAVLAVNPEHAAARYYLHLLEKRITEQENQDRYVYPLAKPPVGTISI